MRSLITKVVATSVGSTLRNAVAALATLTAVAACSGKEEASKMTKFADEMCACADSACAAKVATDAEAFGKANEGKKVSSGAADDYNKAAKRMGDCFAQKMAAAGAAEPAAEPAGSDKPAVEPAKAAEPAAEPAGSDKPE